MAGASGVCANRSPHSVTHGIGAECASPAPSCTVALRPGSNAPPAAGVGGAHGAYAGRGVDRAANLGAGRVWALERAVVDHDGVARRMAEPVPVCW